MDKTELTLKHSVWSDALRVLGGSSRKRIRKLLVKADIDVKRPLHARPHSIQFKTRHKVFWRKRYIPLLLSEEEEEAITHV